MTLRRPRLKWHKLRRKRSDPPFFRENLGAGLASGAALEIDLVATADRHFVCLHELTLDKETTGTGPVAAASRAEVSRLRQRNGNGAALDEPPLFLDEIVATVANLRRPTSARIQIDIKETAERFDDRMVLRMREMLGDHVGAFLASGTDARVVEQVRRLAPDLAHGFDPLDLYPDGIPGTTAELDALAEATLQLAPGAAIYYLEADLVLAGLDRGVNLIDRVKVGGAEVDVWTLDTRRSNLVSDLGRLIDAGCDQITTNEPLALEEILREIA